MRAADPGLTITRTVELQGSRGREVGKDHSRSNIYFSKLRRCGGNRKERKAQRIICLTSKSLVFDHEIFLPVIKSWNSSFRVFRKTSWILTEYHDFQSNVSRHICQEREYRGNWTLWNMGKLSFKLTSWKGGRAVLPGHASPYVRRPSTRSGQHDSENNMKCLYMRNMALNFLALSSAKSNYKWPIVTHSILVNVICQMPQQRSLNSFACSEVDCPL